MARTVRQNKFWLIAAFVLTGVCSTFLGWQRIYAQTPPVETPPGVAVSATGTTAAPTTAAAGTDAAAGAGATTSTVPTEPEVAFGQAVHSGVTVSSKKNWDGRVFSSLKFKYRTVDGRTLTVILPAEYKREKKTRAGWETLFVVYAMDTEIEIDRRERAMPPDVSAFAGQLMAMIRGQAGNRPAPEIIQEAIRTYLPSMGGGNVSLPPMLPTMP